MGKTTISGYCSKDAIELMLARTSRTSPGIDDIQYVEYKDCFAELSNVVTKIMNLSVELNHVPSACHTAAIMPVPNCMSISSQEIKADIGYADISNG